MNARPTMSDFGMVPMKRLSFELPRLSPITKYWLGPTFCKGNMLVIVPGGR